MRQTLLYIFGPLALAGLVLSVATHIAALMGKSGPLGDSVGILHFGIFIVWIPAVIVAKGLTRGLKRSDFWKAVLRGVPVWVRYAMYGLFAYTFVNFVIFIGLGGSSERHATEGMSPETARGFSGHWMLFYAAALAILYSASNVSDRDRQCPNGHRVDALAAVCETCGGRVSHPPSAA